MPRIEPEGLVVTRYALTPSDWPADRKLSITVIADLHAGGPDMLLPHVREVVDTANALQSDLIVLLGDFIASYRSRSSGWPIRSGPPNSRGFSAPLGTWAILGNHDWWHDLAWRAQRARARCAFPCSKTMPCCSAGRGQKFWLAGIGDQLAYRLGHGRFRGVDDLAGHTGAHQYR